MPTANDWITSLYGDPLNIAGTNGTSGSYNNSPAPSFPTNSVPYPTQTTQGQALTGIQPTTNNPPQVPTVDPTNAETAKGALDWMQEWLPNMSAYWTNYANNMTQGSDQLMQQSMEAFNQRMNESGDVFGAGMQGMDDALKSAYDFYNQGSQGMTDVFNAANLPQLIGNVQTGSVNPQMDQMLQQIMNNSYANAQRQLNLGAGNATRDIMQKMGAENMIDSTRTTNALQGINRDVLGQLGATTRDLESNYLATRLGLPGQILQSAVGGVQGAVPYSNTMLDLGKTGFSNANNNFNSLMQGSLDLARQPVEMFKMANEQGRNARSMGDKYFGDITDIWKEILNYDIQNRRIDADLDINDDDGNFFTNLFGF